MSGSSALPYFFGALTAGSVCVYVLMDGWDLGVGILYPLLARDADASVLLDSIAPFWDANETWLVFGGMMLLSGFPLAYAALLPHLYLPLFMMLVSLVLRGVGYEFGQQGGGVLESIWRWAFSLGSMTAALCQGWILGVIVQGIDPPTAGNASVLAVIGRNAFPCVCAAGVLGAYALLGCCWLILKTRGAVQTLGREVALPALILTGSLLVAISVWTPLSSAHVARRWFEHLSVLWVLPLAALILCWRLKSSLWQDRDGRPLLWAVLLCLSALAGIAISLYPFIVPYRYTVLDAANDLPSLRFAGAGIVIVLPFTLLYLSLAYRVFRGKSTLPAETVSSPSPSVSARRTSGLEVDLHLS